MRSRLLRQETVFLIRASGTTTYDGAGQPVPSADKSPVKVKCNIQPLPKDEVVQLPESDRERVLSVMYSECEVMLKDQINRFPQTNDQESHEVLKLGNWTHYPDLRTTKHYRSVLAKIES